MSRVVQERTAALSGTPTGVVLYAAKLAAPFSNRIEAATGRSLLAASALRFPLAPSTHDMMLTLIAIQASSAASPELTRGW